MTEPRESEWQRIPNCVRTLTGKDMTVGEMADACNTDAGAIVAALEELNSTLRILSLDLSERVRWVGRWRPIWPVDPRFGGGLTP